MTWGEPYAKGTGYITDDGRYVEIHRGKHNRTRFYDTDGNQVGPEQLNVAPAVAYAISMNWKSVIH